MQKKRSYLQSVGYWLSFFILRNQIGIQSRSVSIEQLLSCVCCLMNLGEFFFHVFSLLNKIRRHEKGREIQGKFIEAQWFCCVTHCDGAHPKLPLSAAFPTQRKRKVPRWGLMVHHKPSKQQLRFWKRAGKIPPINTGSGWFLFFLKDDQHLCLKHWNQTHPQLQGDAGDYHQTRPPAPTHAARFGLFIRTRCRCQRACEWSADRWQTSSVGTAAAKSPELRLNKAPKLLGQNWTRLQQFSLLFCCLLEDT